MPHPQASDTALAFLHDAARCLALADAGHLRFTPRGRLDPASLAALVAHTAFDASTPSPQDDQDAPLAAFLCHLLIQADLLNPLDDILRPTPAVDAWLRRPAPLQVADLRLAWFTALEITWRWLPPSRRQAYPSRYWRHLLRAAAAELVAAPSRWTSAPALLAVLHAHRRLTAPGPWRNLPTTQRAITQRTRLLLAFSLEQVLPCLGLVDTAPHPDGPRLRPTDEGAAWLRAALALLDPSAAPLDTRAAEAPPFTHLSLPTASGPALLVADDLRLSVDPSAPAACVYRLHRFAHLQSTTPPARYAITRSSFESALAHGLTAATILFELTQYGVPPPPAVAQLHAWQAEASLVTVAPGYRLTFHHPAAAEALRHRDTFRQRAHPLATGHDFWVDEANAALTLRYLRRLGYVPSPASAPPAPPPSGPLYPSLPLREMLVVLHTYTALRRHVAGLADLALDDLAAALHASLAPDDRLAAERLSASHAALLARALGGPRAAADLPVADDPPLRDRLQAAITAGSPLHLTYVDSQARLTRRTVQPLRLESRLGHEYLVAHCALAQAERSFRLDRIVALR